MNRLGIFVTVLALGAGGLSSSCSKAGSGATGAMFIESCGLNCSSNGATGGQISCGVISIYKNQEIGILFSKPVDFGSVGNQSFQIADTTNASIPVGSFLLDPFDSRRVIFRPSLTFDVNGNPVFGFRDNATYQIFVPGRVQGDPAPFINSTGGTENASRMDCTVLTSLGINDPVPGPPLGSVFVSTPGNPSTPANGATGVLLTSKVTLQFNDLMNIGTLVQPGSGTSPSITVKLDPDGNVANTSDQVVLQGTFTFSLDQLALQTTVVFTPAQPFPGAGTNLASPRKIVVNLSNTIRDLTGNTIGNAGPVAFTPQQVTFPPVTIPTGGEQFTNLNNCDQNRSGASWGESTLGRLTPGLGGGSGRLGDLRVAAGETVTLHTGPTFGVGRIQFINTAPLDGDIVDINGVQFQILDGFGTGGGFVNSRGSFGLTLANLARELNNSVNPLVSGATYSIENSTTLKIVSDTVGATGLNYTFDAYRIIGGGPVATPSVAFISGPTVPVGTAHLLDGVDAEAFAAGNLVDNFDFQANPGGTPNDIAVANGNFEFASLVVESGGLLRLVGPNAARVLVRGKAVVQGLIDVSGESKGTHQSDDPAGQLAADGGPNAGSGGAGADRPDNTGTDLLAPGALEPFRPWNFGIVNPGASLAGGAGVGVGQVGTIAAGPQGLPHPGAFPVTRTNLGAMQTDASCVSEQVGAAGGGGAYSLDGGIGVAVANNPVAIQGASNTPPDTAGGDATNVGLEAPTAVPLNKRKLTPEKGHLKGGSGGGGAGAHVAQTATNANGVPEACIDAGAAITNYRSHSAGAGGGGGGAIQLQAGRSLALGGGIDASGGDGGSADENNLISTARLAAPGGGGSGGAILLQAKQLFLSAVPSRMSIAGGLGGVGFTTAFGPSLGGAGGPGLARVEAEIAPLAIDVAAILDPIDPLDPTSLDYLSVGTFVRSRNTPASFQGAQSCWMRPTGSFFAVDFSADAVGAPGWDMDLVLDFGAGPVTVPYRAPNGILPGGQTYEQFWGQLLDAALQVGEVGAPIVVRFQGAKLTGAMPDPCNVDISGPSSPLAPGSLTPWVRHPSELNDFGTQPDMVRFVILFDASKLDFQKIVGVTNLRIQAQPN
ncbi:MAG: Ig-like domain-containing protein [Planctomycetes bacterium]|nr:Ig-like domain-containing protein [Planctomycetota bacterium]